MTARVSRDDPTPPASPRQLPPATENWVNRAELLTTLASHAATEGPTKVLLRGLPGIGKTAAALRFLDTARAALQPDGELYADLDADYGCSPDLASTVLADWLLQLGVPADRIPEHRPQRAALFRTVTAERTLLILLDNATDTQHIRTLLPTGPDCVVVATSRRRLPALELDGFRLLDVGPLSTADGVALLTAHRTPDIPDDECHTLRVLSELCGGNALTLRVAAALLATDPHLTPAGLIAAITARSASALSIGDTSLGALLSMTYEALTPRAQQLYRLLGDCPATDLTAAPLAEALHCSRPGVETALDELIEHHLVTVDPQRRCRIVAAVRDDALARSDDTDDADTRLARIRRVVEWYLRRTAAADTAINPAPPRHSPIYDRLGSTAAFDHARDGQAWFDAERHTVLTWLSLCGQYSWDDLLLQFTEAAWNPLRAAGYAATELVATQKLGLAAAIRTGNRLSAVFAARRAFGLTNLGDHHDAIDAAADAVDRAAATGDSWTMSMTLSTLGRCYLRAGLPRAAIVPLTAALAQDLGRGDLHSAALRHRRLGEAHRALGGTEIGTALTHLRTSVALMTQIGDQPGLARSLTYLADGLVAAGRAKKALNALRDARAVTDRPESARYDVQTAMITARAYWLLGNTAQAAEHCAHALTSLTPADASADPDRDALETLLDDILADAWTSPAFCPDLRSTARITNLYAGGENHYALEREFRARLPPRFRAVIKAQHAFRRRAVDYARALGVDQILDIGCGIPVADSTDADIAGSASVRVVYADREEHADAIMNVRTSGTGQAAAVRGDFLVPETVLYAQGTRVMIDFERPVCLVLTGLLEHCPPDTDLAGVLRRYLDHLAPGSVVVLSHLTLDGLDPADPVQASTRAWMLDLRKSYEDTQDPMFFRDRADIARIVADLDVVEPGIGWTYSWSQDTATAHTDAELPVCVAVVGQVRRP